MQFIISAAYEWKKEGKSTPNSELAIKKLIEGVKKQFEKQKKVNPKIKIEFKRLRASAGKTMLASIQKRIANSQIIIFDISNKNPNVFLELGIALQILEKEQELYIYLIKEKTSEDSLLASIPSDLQGYFVSEYFVKNNVVTFKDQNSARMSIVSNIKDFYKKDYPGDDSFLIDEIIEDPVKE